MSAMAEPQLADEIIATDPEGIREQALRSLKKRRDFHTHLFVYLTFNVLLWSIWALTGATSGAWFPWPLWVTFGWGIAIVLNGWDVYVRRPITEAELQHEVERLAQRR
jgi:hypothetical protein